MPNFSHKNVFDSHGNENGGENYYKIKIELEDSLSYRDKVKFGKS